MPKQMPGYQEHQDKLTAAQNAVEAKRLAAAKKKNDDAEDKKQKKLTAKKLGYVKKSIKGSSFGSFLKGFASAQTIAFVIGSLSFLVFQGRLVTAEEQYEANAEHFGYGHVNYDDYDDTYDSGIYGDMSYGQAIKNAYLLDDWRKGEGGVFQGICGMLSILIALGVGVSNAKEKNNEKNRKASEILKQLEQLKNYGIDAPTLIKDLTPSINKILESLSKIDRGYFDNLIAGGLNKADYETCVAIVSGYLKSHPKEYNQVIAIIDEATLPPEIVKKYGKGKTISFAAAQAMQFEK
ncbi:MAG: hypothetical protein J6W41_02445 [Alphaproteobacteria bacterium]|nr:hypothetical protein [Alphaproteobacteria bacterium]